MEGGTYSRSASVTHDITPTTVSANTGDVVHMQVTEEAETSGVQLLPSSVCVCPWGKASVWRDPRV